MNRLIKNLLTLSAVAIFAVSCNEEDPEDGGTSIPDVDVTVTINGDAATAPYELEVGDSIGFSISGTAEGGFNTLNVYQSVDGGADVNIFTTNRDILGIDAGTQVLPVIEIGKTLTTNDLGEVVFTAEIIDDAEASLIGDEEVMVTVTSPEARSYSTILLAAPLQDDNGTPASKTSETFFSTNTGLTYSMADINGTVEALSGNVDFGYFYGSGQGGTEATLSDPASYPFVYGQAAWGTRNSTTFKRTSLTSSNFTEAQTFADIDAEYEAADDADEDPGIESGLVEGEVLAFATDSDKEGGSKKGLILVKAITAGDGENGSITLDILVQEEASVD